MDLVARAVESTKSLIAGHRMHELGRPRLFVDLKGARNVPELLKTLGADPPVRRADKIVVAYLFCLGLLPNTDVVPVEIVFWLHGCIRMWSNA